MAAAPCADHYGDGSEVGAVILPSWPVQNISRRKETVSARGLNYSDDFEDGDLAQCENLSSRRWPYLATRNGRRKLTEYQDVTALSAWNGLVAVRGTDLVYDGQVVGTVTAGAKQFAAVNTKLVIWPDKVYLDLTDMTVKDLAAKAEATGATVAVTEVDRNGYVSYTTTITFTFAETTDLTTLFKPGDGVELAGFSHAENNRALVIKTVETNRITVDSGDFVNETVEPELDTSISTEGEEDPVGGAVIVETEGDPEDYVIKITMERKVPEMDFICESKNRLWGVSNETKTIYSSALGDPTNFNVFSGISTDSYALPVATAGDFTGCCKLSSSVLFFKEQVLHRIYGDYPAEYAMHTTEMEGLRAGCHKSLTIINDALFYVGLHGVFTYAGGTPVDISRIFGNHVLTEAVGCTDGEKFWLSVLVDGEKGLYVFDPNVGAWLKEDRFRFTDIARIGEAVYLLKEDGTVWLADSGEPDRDIDWMLEYAPFYEDTEGQGRKRVTRLLIRAELEGKAWMAAETRTGPGPKWTEAGKIKGPGEDMIVLNVPPNRGDVYRVRLRGHGPCTLKNVVREHVRGGDG